MEFLLDNGQTEIRTFRAVSLSLIFREKYEHTKINFRSIADLRRNVQSHHGYKESLVTLSMLELIKTYIINKEHDNGNKKQDVSVRCMYILLGLCRITMKCLMMPSF